MKYVVKYDAIWYTSDKWEEEHEQTYVVSIDTGEFPRRKGWKPTINGSTLLRYAKLYDSWDAASAICSLVQLTQPSARIYGVEEKEIFRARLANK